MSGAMLFPDTPEGDSGPQREERAIKRIVAYFMHEYEEQQVVDLLDPDRNRNGRRPLERTRSFVLADATDNEIQQLTREGILVEQLQDQSMVRSLTESSFAESFSEMDRDTSQRYVMQLDGPLLPERIDQLQRFNVTILEAMGNHVYRVMLRPADEEDVDMLPFVTGLRVEQSIQEDSFRALNVAIDQAGQGAFAPAEDASVVIEDRLQFDVWLTADANPEQVLDRMHQLNVVVEGAEGRKIRLQLVPNSAEQSAVASLPGVELLEQFIPPDLHNDCARRIMNIDQSSTAGATISLPWDGAGQTIAIADTGIDDKHPDFGTRIIYKIPLGRSGLTNDPHGHGTHVAGSAAGDGTASSGDLKGTAPGASIYFQSVLGPPLPTKTYPLSGLPIALASLFDPPYQAGARIHNNSWGAMARSYYRLSSREVDDYVSQHRDMLIVISAGNEGSTAQPIPPAGRNSQAGFVDWYSIGAPATCKNGLTVGASQSDTSGGYGSKTYTSIWPNSFPPANPALAHDIAAQKISGNSDEVAGFSSRGMGASNQIKPDVVAPGTDIASARSSLAPSVHFSGAHAKHAQYSHMCGTSMAAPLVSGVAAVVRQYYSQVQNYANPSAALMKATIINGTRAIGGVQATAAPGGFPNNHQGFGLVDMATTLPTTQNPFAFHYFDNWQDPSTHLSISDRQRFQFTVSAGTAWLRICLCYTDVPGGGVQNSLFMSLHLSAAGKKWYSNENQVTALAALLPKPGRYNNVGIIRVDSPAAGDYLLQVSPANLVPGGKQDFAVVVTSPGITSFNTRPFNS